MAEGQNIVVDLEFGDKMKPNEISSLVQQVRMCSHLIMLCLMPLIADAFVECFVFGAHLTSRSCGVLYNIHDSNEDLN